jgi:hypothetical protein
VGEIFNHDELTEFMKLATDYNSTNSDMIDIRRLSKFLLPKLSAREGLLKGPMNSVNH